MKYNTCLSHHHSIIVNYLFDWRQEMEETNGKMIDMIQIYPISINN